MGQCCYCECPKCKNAQYTDDNSRFRIFTCTSCGWRFRGIHARAAYWAWLIPRGIGIQETTPCPNGCKQWVSIYAKEGDVCESCGESLPTKPAIQESKSIFDDDEDYLYWQREKIEKVREKTRQLKKAKYKEQRIKIDAWREQKEKEQTGEQTKQVQSVFERAQESIKRMRLFLKELKEKELQEEKELQKQLKEEELQELQEEQLKEQKTKLNQLKEQQANFNQLIFWKDYLKITNLMLNKATSEELKQLKQILLNNFEISKQEQYRATLHNVEIAIKKAL